MMTIQRTTEYSYDTEIEATMDEAYQKVAAALADEGFGILTEIDVKATFKKKLDVDFRPYRILGACNPGFAHKALLAESNIGLMLPCNVVIQELAEGKVKVSAIDPVAAMAPVANDELPKIAGEVRNKLKRVVASL